VLVEKARLREGGSAVYHTLRYCGEKTTCEYFVDPAVQSKVVRKILFSFPVGLLGDEEKEGW
jgi:hypothetical protein